MSSSPRFNRGFASASLPGESYLATAVRVVFLLVLALAFNATPLIAQSTYGSIVGTVKDQSGGVIVGAALTLVNGGTAARSTQMTDAGGSYTFANLGAGTYALTVNASGFEKAEFLALDLQAREVKRVDALLHVGAQSQTVVVQDTSAGVINTETSSLAATKTGNELVDLPVAIYSRSAGSTSPISTLTTEPGVQTDDSGDLVVAGTTPALMSVTIDGISSVNVESSGPINELFPSFNSISEIRVSETNNNAEYSGVSDITTTSKSGTNALHGGVFENLENTALNSGNTFTGKPKIIMNDFGGYAGGPVMIPKLYYGKDKTFYFFSYEALRLPRETPLSQINVPSNAMRGLSASGAPLPNGADLCSYLAQQGVAQIYQPNGTPIPCAAVPISPVAANALKYLYPLANAGAPDSYANNYVDNFPAPISSNQWDLRLDQVIHQNQNFFVRYTYKNRSVASAPNPNCYCSSQGSPAVGAFSQPEEDRGLTFAYNYSFSAKLINEFRGGFNSTRTANTLALNSGTLLNQIGITGIPTIPTAPVIPYFQITGFMGTGGGTTTHQQSKIIQLLDNLTWIEKNHAIKVGGDARRLTDHDENVFGAQRLGQYTFNNGASLGIGDPYAAFLLGYPDETTLSQVTDPAMNGLGYAYAFYAQDDWKATPKLTINLGFRWELHPPVTDTHNNTAAFLPDAYGFYNGQSVHGAVVVPGTSTLSLTNPSFAASIAPTPILTASQAGITPNLRYTDRTDFGPRVGFAWRPFGNENTVIRGGWGRFIESPLGFSLVSGWAVSASSLNFYPQGFDANGKPLLSFPSPFPANLNTTGTVSFQYAFPVHYHDPSVQQWNLTYERDLGYTMGLRVSYVGSHGGNLETFEDLNQVPANTIGYFPSGNSPGAIIGKPYPIWGTIQSVENAAESNYNSLSTVVQKRFTNGLQFESSYVYTRDLSNEGGANPTAFVGAGGNYVTDRFHVGLDYGNVVYDRRDRFLTTYLYELPFGRGRKLLSGSNAVVDKMVNGWELGGVLIFQSGPFLTVSQSSADPAGTNVNNVVGSTRADVVPGVRQRGHYLAYFNPTAWQVPGQVVDANGNVTYQTIGRFGNSSVGSVVGPGTAAVSMSLIKTVKFTEQLQMQFGAEASNLLNHRNYEPPNMAIDSSSFGVINALQTAEGAGPRNVELTGRISF